MTGPYWNHNVHHHPAVPARRYGGKRGPVGMPMEDVHISSAEIRRMLHRLLPGCTVRRTPLWRHAMVWDRPREGGP
ncbi:hypothetical protein ACWCQ0_35705 [Streptomyces massasporeus]|uniref:Uncharacterized protein n=1 Tax=Streptomyces massasporeus TaxID=67324 RepID=A0ABW6LUA5_9ACTN